MLVIAFILFGGSKGAVCFLLFTLILLSTQGHSGMNRLLAVVLLSSHLPRTFPKGRISLLVGRSTCGAVSYATSRRPSESGWRSARLFCEGV